MSPSESNRGVLEKTIEKVPVWVLSLSILGIFLLIGISIYLEKPFAFAGLQFGAIETDKHYVTKDNNVPVGTIVASVLSPEDFSNHYGNNWAIADGREIGTDTKYYDITGKREIPDIRGRFLRGLNLDAKIDPQVNRKVGDHQGDSTKLPESLDLSQGRHAHMFEIANVVTTKHAHRDGGSAFWTRKSTHAVGNEVFEITTHESGIHKHEIVGGDAETRPKNTSVYFYIKIDDKVNNPVTGTPEQ